MRSRSAALAVLVGALGIASPFAAEPGLDADVASVRLSERGSGGFYNLIVHAQGADAFRVASVRVGVPGEPLAVALPVARYAHRLGGRGVIPGLRLDTPQTIDATLRGADGSALGAARRFVANGAGRAERADAAVPEGAGIERLIVTPAAAGVSVGVQVDAMAAREAASVRVVVGPEHGVEIPLAPERAIFRAVVVLEDRTIGARDPLAVWMLDAEGAPLGPPQRYDVAVEAAKE